jgi:hypothetical protein
MTAAHGSEPVAAAAGVPPPATQRDRPRREAEAPG